MYKLVAVCFKENTCLTLCCRPMKQQNYFLIKPKVKSLRYSIYLFQPLPELVHAFSRKTPQSAPNFKICWNCIHLSVQVQLKLNNPVNQQQQQLLSKV